VNARLQPAVAWRALGFDDVGAVLEVESQCYSFPWSRGNFVDSLAAGYRAEALWHADGELIGYCVAQPGVDEMHLLNLTTAPRWQRQGHATHLLQRLLAYCRDVGLPVVILEVRPGNQPARALYARHGFVEVGRRRGYYPAPAGREDALVLRAEVPGR
jgi:[ribosomal protein S18]-alanine N-acetyltransferase